MTGDDTGSHRNRYDRIVSAIENARIEAADRLTRFHRSAVAKVRPDPDLLKLGGHGSSALGLWYAERKDAQPIDQPAFETLVALHEALLNHIALLAGRAWKDAKVPVEEYDALLEKVRAFDELAGRLVRAFQAAISDLDPLTGAQTRQVMLRDLRREVQRARRSGTPGCLAIADIDRFKSINDSHGHAVGNSVLATVSGLLIESLRPYDSVYRYGGEEFLLCLPETSPEEARRVLDRVRERIAGQPVLVDGGKQLAVTISFGMTLMTPRRPLAELIDRADKALYIAKEHGRNRVEVWRAEGHAGDA